MNQTYDCIVIGAGVAGMTAAIYLKRANINVLLLESSVPGGQINRSARVENYPGFLEIDGPTLAMKIYEQIQNLKIEYQYGEVIDIIDQKNQKIVKTEKEEFLCKGVIIATGRIPKELGLDQETELVGHGISWCAICDGPFFKEKDVCVVGGGNSALEESLYLSKICKKVTIINRSEKLRADSILVEEAKIKDNIHILYNSVVNTINEKEGYLSSILIEQEGNIKEIKCDGLFIYIGSKPNTHFARNMNIKMQNDYIIVDHNMRTNIKGIYACGDVIYKDVYQISTAIGEGTVAAMSFKKDTNL